MKVDLVEEMIAQFEKDKGVPVVTIMLGKDVIIGSLIPKSIDKAAGIVTWDHEKEPGSVWYTEAEDIRALKMEPLEEEPKGAFEGESGPKFSRRTRRHN